MERKGGRWKKTKREKEYRQTDKQTDIKKESRGKETENQLCLPCRTLNTLGICGIVYSTYIICGICVYSIVFKPRDLTHVLVFIPNTECLA